MSWFLSRLMARCALALAAVLASFLIAWGLVVLVPVLFMHLLNFFVKGQF